LRPISAQSRISTQRAMQSGNTGTGAGPAGGSRLGATTSTMSATNTSDWSTSVDSRPPRGGTAKSTQNRAGQRNNQAQQQAPASNNSRQVRIVVIC
jgi:hypothetical protein